MAVVESLQGIYIVFKPTSSVHNDNWGICFFDWWFSCSRYNWVCGRSFGRFCRCNTSLDWFSNRSFSFIGFGFMVGTSTTSTVSSSWSWVVFVGSQTEISPHVPLWDHRYRGEGQALRAAVPQKNSRRLLRPRPPPDRPASVSSPPSTKPQGAGGDDGPPRSKASKWCWVHARCAEVIFLGSGQLYTIVLLYRPICNVRKTSSIRECTVIFRC